METASFFGLSEKVIGSIRDRLLQKDRKKALPNEVEKVSLQYLPLVEDIYENKTFFWHGTGRYQYRNGKIVDVLEEIIRDGGLITHEDLYDSSNEIVNTTSFALSRMYARIYSSMYLYEKKKPAYEYGSRLYWATKFIGEIAIKALPEAAKDIGIKNIIRNPIGFMGRLKRNNRAWIGKFRSDSAIYPRPLDIFLNLQTDIPDNYPVLIGVSQNAFQPSSTSGYISKYERRTTDRVSLSKFTHIEVPQEKLSQTKQFLETNGIRLLVIPIEVGERYCSQFNYRTLINGGYIKK